EQRKVLAPVERHLAYHEGDSRQRGRAGETDGVAVGRAFGERIDPGQAAGAGADLDHHLLADLGAEPTRQGAAKQIGGAASSERHDQPDRPIGKGLRPRRRRPQRRDSESGYERASRSAHGSSHLVHFAILTWLPAKTTAILLRGSDFRNSAPNEPQSPTHSAASFHRY